MRRILPLSTLVLLKAPDGSMVEGQVSKKFYSEAFRDNGKPNEVVKVRCLPQQKLLQRLVLFFLFCFIL